MLFAGVTPVYHGGMFYATAVKWVNCNAVQVLSATYDTCGRRSTQSMLSGGRPLLSVSAAVREYTVRNID